MVVPGCPRCGTTVALHEGRPFVTASGSVELWHRACFPKRGAPRTLPPPVVTMVAPLAAPRRRTGLAIGAAVIASALAGLGIARVTLGGTHAAAPALAPIELATAEPARDAAVAFEIAPPRIAGAETALEAKYPMPTLDGDDLDSVYPSLRGWIHPVTASAELMPPLPARHFGAERAGVVDRPECGAGHCGIDLDAPRGRPLVAVADGTIVRVERAELGADGKSGRYVRIQHDDGTLTAYMHMDDVADDLEPGNRVLAGQYIGTLGATAVGNTPPHCHFSLELPNKTGSKGDVRDTHYIDPAPFLVRATIVPTPDRRHSLKPAF